MSAEGSRKFYIIMLLLTFLTLVCIKGCDDDGKSGLPTNNQQGGLSMSIFANPETQAKLTGLTLDVVGLNEAGQPSEPRLSRTISDVNLPVTIPLTLYDPPCRYQGTVTAHLTREAPRVVSREFNICQQSRVTIKIDTFEGFWIANNPIQAPASVNAGAAVDVVCGTDRIDAPDKDRYPLSATLSEQDGSSVSGPFDANAAVSGTFPDPYPLSSPADQRHFTCVISDGHSRPQTFSASVARVTPTVTPAPQVEDPEPPAPEPPAPAPQPPAPQPTTVELSVALTASPAPVPFGTNTTTLTVMLRNSSGDLYVHPVTLALEASNGNLSQSTLTITGGSGTVTLSDDGLLARPENVTVSAQVTTSGYKGSGSTTVTFEGPAPVTNLTVNLTPSSSSVPFGTNSTTIGIELLDNGTPVSGPVTVNLSASNGKLSETTLEITGGSGTVTLSDDGLFALPGDATVTVQVTSSGYSGSGDTIVTFEAIPPTKTLYRSYSCGTPDGSGGCASDPGANVWTDYNDSFSTSEPPVHPKPDCTLGETLNAPISGKTIPLYSYYRWAPYPGGPDGDVKNDSMTTTQRNELEPAGWVNEKPLGYVFKDPIPERTTPLYRRYRNYLYRPENPMDSTDYMTTLDPSENGILGSGWETDRGVGNPLGHILKPTSDSCPQP